MFETKYEIHVPSYIVGIKHAGCVENNRNCLFCFFLRLRVCWWHSILLLTHISIICGVLFVSKVNKQTK